MTEPTLTELLANARTDKQTDHSYGPLYDRWLGPLREAEVQLLEVGVSMFGAGDLLAFAEFLPRAAIWGMDVTLEGIDAAVLDHPRIELIRCDAYADDPFPSATWTAVIDDCVHVPQQQVALFERYWPRVRPGGQYVIEDVHASVMPSLLRVMRPMCSGCVVEVHDLRGQRPGSSDNICFRIAKPQQP